MTDQAEPTSSVVRKYLVFGIYVEDHNPYSTVVEATGEDAAGDEAEKACCRDNNWSYQVDNEVWFPEDADDEDREFGPDWDLNVTNPLWIAGVAPLVIMGRGVEVAVAQPRVYVQLVVTEREADEPDYEAYADLDGASQCVLDSIHDRTSSVEGEPLSDYFSGADLERMEWALNGEGPVDVRGAEAMRIWNDTQGSAYRIEEIALWTGSART